MTLQDFRGKYYLHDSSIEKIDFDAENKTLTLTIEFCFWMQNWYDKTTPKNGLIAVTFENVSLFEYDANISDKIFSNIDSEIRDAELNADGCLEFFSVEYSYDSDRDDIYWLLKINAANVEVTELERYNL
jgi:hypothetical protein